ncbi:hypothetical protein BGZ94_006132, partial [Podila epigama]
MATTATISTSTSPVGRSTVSLVGTAVSMQAYKNSNSNSNSTTASSTTTKTKATVSAKAQKASIPSPVTTVSNLSQDILMSLPSPPASVSAPSPPPESALLQADSSSLPTPCASVHVSPNISPVSSPATSPMPSPMTSPMTSPETKAISLSALPAAQQSAGHSLPLPESSPAPTTTTTTTTPTITPLIPVVTTTLSKTETTATVEATSTTATTLSAEATTFFDDMINAPQPPANILSLSPATSLPDLYHDFFDNHPELYDSDLS